MHKCQFRSWTQSFASILVARPVPWAGETATGDEIRALAEEIELPFVSSISESRDYLAPFLPVAPRVVTCRLSAGGNWAPRARSNICHNSGGATGNWTTRARVRNWLAPT